MVTRNPSIVNHVTLAQHLSSNGLVFFCDDEFGCKQTMYLWNPSIQKFITIPTPKVTIESHGPFDHALGFGFDTATSDYKIVRLAFLQSNNIGASLKVEIYELSMGSWRSINVGDFKYVVDSKCEDHAFFNGMIHWIGHEKDGFFPKFIVTFDTKNEELGVMMMPIPVSPWSIFVFRDSLYLTQQIQTDKHYGIWVMKDYDVAESWTKVITIDMYDSYWAPPFGFRDNGDVFRSRIRSWWGHAVRDLVSYDPKSKQIKRLGILGHPRCFYKNSYVESLVLINDLSEVLGRKENSCDAKVVCKEEEEDDDDNDYEGK
ncbi:hypothetical protein LguiA_026890 [Lonicera macranthoides]